VIEFALGMNTVFNLISTGVLVAMTYGVFRLIAVLVQILKDDD